MKVSVVVPTYNRENYIRQAVDSILQQSMNDHEIIVVDDGSTDDTDLVLGSYMERIRYIKTENRGPSHARNVGMKVAKGEYISFLDSDDLYYPYKIELQAKILDDFPEIAMVCSEFSGFDDQGYWDEYHLKKYHRPGYEGGNLTYDKIFEDKRRLDTSTLSNSPPKEPQVYFGNIFETYYNYQILCTNTIMFRRRILDTIGYQNENYRIMEEHDFAQRITKYFKIAFLDIPTYKLRYHGNQLSDVTRNRARVDGLDITIEKQRTKLLTAIELGFEDKQYYFNNREMVDRRLYILRKALAIPLMCKNDGAREARGLFNLCGQYRQREYIFWLATYLPKIGRKAFVKLYGLYPHR